MPLFPSTYLDAQNMWDKMSCLQCLIWFCPNFRNACKKLIKNLYITFTLPLHFWDVLEFFCHLGYFPVEGHHQESRERLDVNRVSIFLHQKGSLDIIEEPNNGDFRDDKSIYLLYLREFN